MKIISEKQAKFVEKPTGIKTNYYLFPEYEVHYNEQPTNTEQDWHYHEKISETVFIIEGELLIIWRENDEEKSQIVKTGDLIQTEDSPHTFKNESGGSVKFLVIKQVLKGENNQEIFKNDKVEDK